MKSGQRLRLSLPGGGGYGDPKARRPAAVGNDLEAEYITKDEALRDYGYKP